MPELSRTPERTIDKLLRLARDAARRNPRKLGLLAAGDTPSISSFGTVPSSGSYNTLPASSTSAADYAPYVTLLGGWPVYIANSAIYPNCLTKTLGAATGGSSADAYQGASRLQFYMDGNIVAFGIQNSTQGFRVLVDGQYESLSVHANGTTALAYWTLDFTACTTPRKVRKIEIEFPGATTPLVLGRIYALKADSIWAVPAGEVGPRVMIASDSYGLGTGATVASDGFARMIGDWCGWDDVWTQGRSGAGWMRGINTDGGPNALDSITDITSWSPDLVIFALGFNDMNNEGATVRAGTISSATVAAQALATIVALRAAKPYLPIIVIGPWRASSGSVRARQATYDPAILAAVNTLADPFIKTISAIGIQTGSGRVGATAGDGNSDYYIDTDNTHPPTVGHAYIGQLLASRIVSALESMVV